MENENDVKGGLVIETLKRYAKRLYDFTGQPVNVSLEIWYGTHRDNPGYSVGFTVYDSGADKFLVQNLTWKGDDIREIGKLIDYYIEAERGEIEK